LAVDATGEADSRLDDAVAGGILRLGIAPSKGCCTSLCYSGVEIPGWLNEVIELSASRSAPTVADPFRTGRKKPQDKRQPGRAELFLLDRDATAFTDDDLECI